MLRNLVEFRSASDGGFAQYSAIATDIGCREPAAIAAAIARADGSMSRALTSRGFPSVSVPVLSNSDGVDFGKPLQRRAVLDHDAFLEQPARRHDLDDRNGEAQRARAGDDQDGDRDRDGCVPIAGGEHPAEERQKSDCVDDGRIEGGGTVGQPAISRSSPFGCLHHPDHLREERVFGTRRGP